MCLILFNKINYPFFLLSIQIFILNKEPYKLSNLNADCAIEDYYNISDYNHELANNKLFPQTLILSN